MEKKIYDFFLKLFETFVSIVYILIKSSFRIKYSKNNGGKKTIHVLANGPSLSLMLSKHIEWLKKQDVLVVNYFAINNVFYLIKPKYYVLIDPAYFGDVPYAKEFECNMRLLFEKFAKVDWDLTLFIPYSHRNVKINYIKERMNNSRINILQFNCTRITGFTHFQFFAYKKFWGVPSTKNVLIPSVMLMLNSGFKHIYLYGAEFSWTKNYNVDSKTGKIYADDRHFYDNTRIPFNKGGYRFSLNCIVEALGAMETIEKYASNIGAKVINRTPGSFIDAFEYENPENILFL